MHKTRISLQAILLGCYVILIIVMLGNIIFDFITLQRNEILPASICLIVFIFCFISGLFNVFYYQKISKTMYITFIFYLLLPISIPLLILEIKYKDKLNNEIVNEKSRFTRNFILITTLLQIIELILLFGFILKMTLTDSQKLITLGLYFLIPFILALFGLICSWTYFVTNIKFFKFMMIFNILFGFPLFFLNFIIINNNKITEKNNKILENINQEIVLKNL